MSQRRARDGRSHAAETQIARLIANTRRRRRPDNLLEIARTIRWLERELGGLVEVSRTVGLSTGMLRRFLSVERLCPEVQQMVQNREIDIVNIVYYVSTLDARAQRGIAEQVIAGHLSGEDVRVLTPLLRSVPDLSLDSLISKVRESKDIRLYVAYFHVPSWVGTSTSFMSRFEDIVGHEHVVSLEVEDQIGVLQVTRRGHERLREAAKERGLSLQRLVETVVLEPNTPR